MVVFQLANGSFLNIPQNMYDYLLRLHAIDPQHATEEEVLDAFTFPASNNFNYEKDAAAYMFVTNPLRALLSDYNFRKLSINKLVTILCGLDIMEWPRYDERLDIVRTTITEKFNTVYSIDTLPIAALRALRYVRARELHLSHLALTCNDALTLVIRTNDYKLFPSVEMLILFVVIVTPLVVLLFKCIHN